MRLCAIQSSQHPIHFFRFFVVFVCFVLLISVTVSPAMALPTFVGEEQHQGSNFGSTNLEGNNISPTVDPINNQVILEDSSTT